MEYMPSTTLTHAMVTCFRQALLKHLRPGSKGGSEGATKSKGKRGVAVEDDDEEALLKAVCVPSSPPPPSL